MAHVWDAVGGGRSLQEHERLLPGILLPELVENIGFLPESQRLLFLLREVHEGRHLLESTISIHSHANHEKVLA
jgi:hypothetical protein